MAARCHSCGVVHDVAIGVIHGDAVSVVGSAGHSGHSCYAYCVHIVVILQIHQFLHLCLELVNIEQLVHELVFHVVFRIAQRYHVVGILVELCNGHLAALRHVGTHRVPYSVDECRHLLLVGVAHLVAGEHLGCTLVGSYFHHLHLDAELCHQVFHEHRLRADSAPFHLTAGVEIHFVGNRREVVCGLCIHVAVCHYPLAALLEVYQRLAHRLQRSVRVRDEESRLYVNALHLVVVLCLLDGEQQVVESYHVGSAAGEHRHDVVFGTLLQLSVQVYHEYRVVSNVLCGT